MQPHAMAACYSRSSQPLTCRDDQFIELSIRYGPPVLQSHNRRLVPLPPCRSVEQFVKIHAHRRTPVCPWGRLPPPCQPLVPSPSTRRRFGPTRARSGRPTSICPPPKSCP